MDNDSYIPKGLQFLIKTISQYSSNTNKYMTTAGNNAVAPSQSFSVDFPQNSLVDLDSLTMCGRIASTSAVPSDFPPAECFIHAIEVKCGGQSIDRVDQYGDLFTTMRNITSTTANTSHRAIEAFDVDQILLDQLPKPLRLGLATNVAAVQAGDTLATWMVEFKAAICRICGLYTAGIPTVIAPGATAAVVAWGVGEADGAASIIAAFGESYVLIAAALGYTLAWTAVNVYAGDTTTGDRRVAFNLAIDDFYHQVVGVVKQYLMGATHAAGFFSTPFAINTWLGFIGSNSHRLIDTSTMPKITLEITMAPSAVIGSATAVYTIAANSLYFTLKSIQFPKYQQMLYAALGSSIPIRYNYTKWINLSRTLGTADTTLSYQMSARNLKRILYTQKASTFQTRAVNRYEQGITPYFTFARGASDGMWWTIDNVHKPQYHIDLVNHGYHHLLLALGKNGDTTYDNLIENRYQFNNTKFLSAVDFCYMGDDKGVVSGLDTGNTQVSISVNFDTAVGTASFAYFFHELGAELQITEGKQVRSAY